jgi:beta-glucosidase
MTEQKLTELLRDMSLEEKVNQMSQVTGGFFNGEIVVTGPMADKGFTEDNVNLAGSVIGSMGAETLKSIQKNYMEKHPHHIPLLFMLDVINGYKTVFPIPLAQGASFEPELSEQCASVAAKEASVSGLHVTFAPMTDLVRDARWGRVMESTGEDPYLNSLFCAAMVRGFQGNSLKDNYAIAACVKHFAGYGAPTAGRDYNTVELSEHTFREFYLPSYQAGIDAGAALVMTLIADDACFDMIPVKKEVKATVSGIYITKVTGVRGPLEKPEGKVSWRTKLKRKAESANKELQKEKKSMNEEKAAKKSKTK